MKRKVYALFIVPGQAINKLDRIYLTKEDLIARLKEMKAEYYKKYNPDFMKEKVYIDYDYGSNIRLRRQETVMVAGTEWLKRTTLAFSEMVDLEGDIEKWLEK